MARIREIRADSDRDTIVVYQAYSDAIADAALRAGRFVPPFSVQRMTWIKPSYLWLMARSRWATRANQTRILAIRLARSAWQTALSEGVLTAFEPRVHHTCDAWQAAFESAPIHIQWDSERSYAGRPLNYQSLQVGISRKRIQDYVSQWIVDIRDLTGLTARIRSLRAAGQTDRARALLPREVPFPIEAALARRLGMDLNPAFPRRPPGS